MSPPSFCAVGMKPLTYNSFFVSLPYFRAERKGKPLILEDELLYDYIDKAVAAYYPS